MLRYVPIAALAALACIQPIGSAAHAARSQAAFPLEVRHPIRDWMPDGDRGLFVEDRNMNWYHASLAGECPDLDSKDKIAFVSVDGGMFDRSSSIEVGARQCQVSSVVATARPFMEDRDE